MTTSPVSWIPIAALFVVTRLAAFFVLTHSTDIATYARYAAAVRESSIPTLYRTQPVEYPHLAVVLFAAVGHLADALPDGVGRALSLRPNRPVSEWEAKFQVAFGLVTVVFDALLLAAVVRLIRRFYPGEEPTARAMHYVVSTACFAPILCDRLDLFVGGFALAAVAARRPATAYALLVLGTGFKLIPAVLLPVWIAAFAARSPAGFGRSAVRHLAAAAALFALWPAASYLLGGGNSAFPFLTYHSARGVNVDAPLGWPLALFDPSTRVDYSFTSFNLTGPLADAAARWAAPVLAGVLVLAYAATVRGFRRAAPDAPRVAEAAACVWMVLILFGKVGSPQYLLWVAPLVPLLPFQPAGAWAAAFVGACLLTTLGYPYLYAEFHGTRVSDDPLLWAGPTDVGYLLLAARTVLLTGLTAVLFVRVGRGR